LAGKVGSEWQKQNKYLIFNIEQRKSDIENH